MIRVLIADDESIIRTSLANIIPWERLGCVIVGCAGNGMEAYNMICDLYPDIVITDVKMPFLDGIQLIERTNKLDGAIEFIILSGYGEFEYAKRAMEHGVRHYILKPTRREELIKAVEKLVLDIQQRQDAKEHQRIEFLKELQFPLQKGMLLTCLAGQGDRHDKLEQYARLFCANTASVTLFMCALAPKTDAAAALQSFAAFLYKKNTPVILAPIATAHALFFFFQADDLSMERSLERWVTASECKGLHTARQDAPLAFRHFASFGEGLHGLLQTLSQYPSVHLVKNETEIETVYSGSHSASVSQLALKLQGELPAMNAQEMQEALRAYFENVPDVATAQAQAIFLVLKMSDTHSRFVFSAQYLQSLQESATIEAIVTETAALLKKVALVRCDGKTEVSYVDQVKKYVALHLDADYLSLKWIAENLLFMSVGYLSKLFVKTEGVKFSDYLNSQRIEHAKKLMKIYRRCSIQDIALKVGFGNNPQYFSQVFKRYEGRTPTDFLNVE